LNPQNERSSRSRVYHGHGADTDIIVASAKAYLAARNRLLAVQQNRSAREAEVAPTSLSKPAPPLRSENEDVRQPKQPKLIREGLGDSTSSSRSRICPAVLYIDLHLIHEVTSPQAFTGLRERGVKVAPSGAHRSRRWITRTPTLTRSISRSSTTQAEEAARRCSTDNCRGVRHHAATRLGDSKNGIVHVVGPERGFTQPGMTIVCGDSHTSTHGAFGSLWRSASARARSSTCSRRSVCLQTRPKTMEVRVDGKLGKGVTAKDIILGALRQDRHGRRHRLRDRVHGRARSATSTMEGRMTVCNMSIEAGARAGMIAPDEKTFAYVEGPRVRAEGRGLGPRRRAMEDSSSTDPGATYDATWSSSTPNTLDADAHLRHEPRHGRRRHAEHARTLVQSLRRGQRARNNFEKAMDVHGPDPRREARCSARR
jgi:hypothetical protein